MPQFPSVYGASGIWTLKKQRRAAGGLDWPPLNGADPQFRNVTMLLHGNGTNGAQNNTFVDSSSNNISITRNGTTAQGTFSPYGDNWSYYFNGSSNLNYTDSSRLNFGTGSYTFEFWIYAPSNNDNFILGNNNTSTIQITTGGSASTVGALRYVAGGNVVATSGSVLITDNAWHHCAIVRNGSSNVTLYVDGVSVGTGTDSTNYTSTSSTVTIGKHNSLASNYLTGYLSNLRVLKGVALFTANFTPPTAPLTAIGGTSLLTCQSNRFLDNSPGRFSFTQNGFPSVERFSPFAPTAGYSVASTGGSAWFDGSTGYLQTASSGGFNAGTGSWTIEGWFYIPRTGAQEAMIVAQTSGVDRFYIRWRGPGGSKLFIGDDSNNLFDNSGLDYKPFYQWTHIALTREGNLYTLYLNGVFYASTTTALVNSATTTFQIGANLNQEFYSNIYICDLRYSQSVVYRSNFTPPTSPLSGGSFLLGGRNAGVIDNAMMNDIQTVGNAQISTAQSKFGGGSMYFDGNGDYLVSAATNLPFTFGTGDFTIEAWIYPASVGAGGITIVSNRFDAGSDSVLFFGFGTSYGLYFHTQATQVLNSGTNATANTWQHVALCRASGTVRIFLNGTQVGSSASSAQNLSATANVFVGQDGTKTSGAAAQFNGYIDDLRITRAARYTSNFSVPTAPFPDQ